MGKPRLTQMSGGLTQVTQLNNAAYGWGFGSPGSWLILLPLTKMADKSLEDMMEFEAKRPELRFQLCSFLFCCCCCFDVCVSILSLGFLICEVGIITNASVKMR